MWRFRTYVSSTGRTEVQDTINRYDDFSREAFSRAVAHLAAAALERWDMPHARKLHGKHLRLYEIRFKANRCATRALGYFGPGPDEFTITKICTHKQNVYSPHDAIETAASRAEQVSSGSAASAALQIDGEDFPPDG